MSANKSVLQTIRSGMDTFSKGQKRIAQYILENYDKAAFMTASKLGQTAQVSESTVVRFAAELGYAGYPDMQKALQELIRGKAYKCAFYVTLLGISIALCAGDYIGKYVNISVVLFVVLCAGVLMYAGYCIFHDAYFALNSRPSRYAIFSVVVAAVNLVGGIVAFVNSRPSLTEYLPSGVVNILCGVMFMILGILFLTKQGMDRQEA